jgi:hypothetical protein
VFAAAPPLRKPLASGVYVYAPLAERLRALSAADHDATILTDRYETAAELLFNGLDARIVVGVPQRAQWMRWHANAPLPQHALLVTFNGPLDANPGLAEDARGAFAHATPLPDIALTYAGVAQDVYHVVQLDDARPDARRALPGL